MARVTRTNVLRVTVDSFLSSLPPSLWTTGKTHRKTSQGSGVDQGGHQHSCVEAPNSFVFWEARDAFVNHHLNLAALSTYAYGTLYGGACTTKKRVVDHPFLAISSISSPTANKMRCFSMQNRHINFMIRNDHGIINLLPHRTCAGEREHWRSSHIRNGLPDRGIHYSNLRAFHQYSIRCPTCAFSKQRTLV